uniref:Testis expressed 53 n=1 Tax=Molossus molossus TaxID=27622 RepID=A0A7J8EHH9_MOLMO|nr:testis expressed 53 [Molossus molossus]
MCRAWLPRDPAEKDRQFPARLRSFRKQPCPENWAQPPGLLLQQDASAGGLSERTLQALSWVALDRRGRASQSLGLQSAPPRALPSPHSPPNHGIQVLLLLLLPGQRGASHPCARRQPKTVPRAAPSDLRNMEAVKAFNLRRP